VLKLHLLFTAAKAVLIILIHVNQLPVADWLYAEVWIKFSWISAPQWQVGVKFYKQSLKQQP
jgi:hypothetical protein